MLVGCRQLSHIKSNILCQWMVSEVPILKVTSIASHIRAQLSQLYILSSVSSKECSFYTEI
jgi:hypothetical protein